MIKSPKKKLEEYGSDDSPIGWLHDVGDRAFLVTHRTQCRMRDREITLWGCVDFMSKHYWPEVEEEGWAAHAHLTVDPDDMHPKVLERVSSGTEGSNLYDITEYGLSVPIGEGDGPDMEDAYAGVIDDLAASMLVGFVLDRRWNRMGTTGWDVVGECVFDENMYEQTRQRIQNE